MDVLLADNVRSVQMEHIVLKILINAVMIVCHHNLFITMNVLTDALLIWILVYNYIKLLTQSLAKLNVFLVVNVQKIVMIISTLVSLVLLQNLCFKVNVLGTARNLITKYFIMVSLTVFLASNALMELILILLLTNVINVIQVVKNALIMIHVFSPAHLD